jgi:hypothetical protein
LLGIPSYFLELPSFLLEPPGFLPGRSSRKHHLDSYLRHLQPPCTPGWLILTHFQPRMNKEGGKGSRQKNLGQKKTPHFSVLNVSVRSATSLWEE